MGAEVNILSNLFLPLGKVRMGYPTGKVRMGNSLNHPDNNQMVFARTKMRKYL